MRRPDFADATRESSRRVLLDPLQSPLGALELYAPPHGAARGNDGAETNRAGRILIAHACDAGESRSVPHTACHVRFGLRLPLRRGANPPMSARPPAPRREACPRSGVRFPSSRARGVRAGPVGFRGVVFCGNCSCYRITKLSYRSTRGALTLAVRHDSTELLFRVSAVAACVEENQRGTTT